MKKKKPKKKAVLKKAVKKKIAPKTVKKAAKKISGTKLTKTTIKAKGKTAKLKKSLIPPGASLEEIGIVTHYFPKVSAAVVKLTKGNLSIGDTIIIKGHTTDFKENVDSIQLEHAPITNATTGQEIGLKVKSRVREHDVVCKLIG